MIQLQHVSKSYQVGDQPVHALVDVTERIRPGEYVAIMGPSGSGKSTLLNVIGCLDRPTRGSYLLNGREVARLNELELSAVRRSSIGYVFQSYHLVHRLDAIRNVELPMVFAGIPPEERRDRVMKALAAVGLSERARHRPAEMSGGQQQRVAVARAIVSRPALVLADEPTANLDSKTSDELMELFVELNEHHSTTFVIATHDQRVMAYAKRLVKMLDGRIVDDIEQRAA